MTNFIDKLNAERQGQFYSICTYFTLVIIIDWYKTGLYLNLFWYVVFKHYLNGLILCVHYFLDTQYVMSSIKITLILTLHDMF